MIRNRLILLLVTACLLAIGQMAASPARAQNAQPVFHIEEIEIVTLRGRFGFTVEMAETDEERSFGLQFRPQLPEKHGMLFDFGKTQPIFMWMKNTVIPLDMVFIDAAGRVTRVAENTTPRSLDVIPSGSPVRSVLEVAAGTAAKLGIGKGSLIRHRIFGTVEGEAAPAPRNR